MVSRYGYTHISTRDLLRAEIRSGSERGIKIGKLLSNGLTVPNKCISDLIKEAMVENLNSAGFIISGYPRQVAQGIELERETAPCRMIFHLEATDEAMEERLLALAEANGSTPTEQERQSIKNRIKAYRKESVPVLQHYEQQGKVVKLDAEDPDKVFAKIKAILDPEEGMEFDECKLTEFFFF
jgi:adenylate kinase